MTSFALGTNPDYADAYSNWFFGGARGPQPQRSSFGPDAPATPGAPAGSAAEQPSYGAYQTGQVHSSDPGWRGAGPEPRRSGTGGQAPYSAYRPGQAQPVQQPSQGTPYGTGSNASQNDSQWGSGGWAYSRAPQAGPRRGDVTPEAARAGMGEPPHSRPQGGPSVMGWPDKGGSQWGSNSMGNDWLKSMQSAPSMPGAAKPTRTTPPSFTPGGGAGNFAYSQPDQRPAPFTTSVNFNGQQMDPGQYYGQRDAFIHNINQARQPFAMNPMGGRPKMDFGSMWTKAGDMVQNGWQNPLSGLMGGGGQPQGRFMAPPGSGATPPTPPPGATWMY